MRSAVLSLALLAFQDADVQIWSVDSLVKVFRDDKPTSQGWTEHAARGEVVSLQVVVRSEAALEQLTGRLVDCPFPARCRMVGYVPVNRKTNVGKNRLRKDPADYPDPLLEDSVNVAAGQAQPVWITVQIPADAAPKLYRFDVELSSKTFKKRHPLEIQVHSACVPKERSLDIANWFFYGTHISKHFGVEEPYSEAGWQLIKAVAKNMADHRQNVILTNVFSLTQYRVHEGKLEFDFTRLDRWIDIFMSEGFTRIEGTHLAHRMGKWEEPYVAPIRMIEDGKAAVKNVPTDSEEADAFFSKFFPALANHLKEKGWLDKYLQHVGDEPIKANFKSYLAGAALVRKYMPGVKIVDAIEAGKSMTDLSDAVDVWVPVLQQFNPSLKAPGKEVWIYTCVQPQGEHANRFIEQPLVKVRLLHWLNFKLGATGYLHWGYDAYVDEDPFTHVERHLDKNSILPAGDAWIVYPKKGGVLDSIRFEAMRDGIEDYELLQLLSKQNPKAAQELVNDPDFKLTKDYASCDLAAFHRLRNHLLALLSEEY